ncbi:hypothetical protein SDC9_150357 [bioreactor metagenome]|uniref:Uncharacterized protein n=1 Tax=bioreactor metagenome TaxID=1076179 RepID=A0A645ERI7_9ZZZZ
MHKAVDRDCRLFARRNGVDGKLRARIAVSAGEDILLRGLVGESVRLKRAVAVGYDFAPREQIAPEDALPDGDQHVIGGDGDGFARVKLRREAALRVKHAGAALEHHARDLAVLAQDADRAPAVVDADVLLHRLFDFFLRGGHLLAGFEAIHRGFG